MSAKFEEAKKRFLEKEDLIYEKEFLLEEENTRVSEEYMTSDSKTRDKILEIYNFDYDEKANQYQFYRLIPSDITDKEISNYVLMNLLENIKVMNERIDTIKFIVVFWFVLTIIGLAIYILGVLNLL